MTLGLTHPAALWLLALAPVAWRLAGGRRRGVWLAATLALAAVGAAGPRLGGAAAPRDVVLLVDRSASHRAAVEGGWPDRLSQLEEQLGPRDRVWLVAFGRTPALVAGPVTLTELRERLRTPWPRVDPDGSALGDALRFAHTLVPGPAEVLLWSDGLEVADRRQVDWLPPAGWRIRALAPAPVVDLRLAALDGPPRVPPGARIALRVTVAATGAGRATVVLRRDGRRVATRVVTLPGPGRTVVAFADRPASAGWVDYRAELTGVAPAGLSGNDGLGLRVKVGGRPPVLWLVCGRPGRWAEAVRGHADVRVRPLAQLAAADLADIAAVVVDDPSAAAMPVEAEALLVEFVRGGGGLVFLGGARSLAAGDWIGRPLEALLPVWLGPPPPERQPPAVAVLVDTSGSMSQSVGEATKLDLARRAVAELTFGLEPASWLAVWGFARDPVALVAGGPLTDDRGATVARLRAGLLGPSGGTRFAPALAVATTALSASGRGARHLVLISDGQSGFASDDARALAGALRAARIRLTAVQTQSGPAPFLSALVRHAGGALHVVRDLASLPRLVLERFRRARWRRVAPGPHRLSRGPAGASLGALAEGPLPALGAAARTPARPGAEVRLVAGSQALPVDVRRADGLRSAFTALGLDDDWGAAAARWPGAAALVAQQVLWAAAGAQSGPVRWQTRFEDGEVVVEAVERGTDRPPRWLEVRADGQSRRLLPVADRVWRIHWALPAGRTHALELAHGRVGRVDARVVPQYVDVPYGPELARLDAGPGSAALRRLATASGGGLAAGLRGWRPGPAPRQRGRSLGGWLLLAAAIALLTGILWRGLGS